MKNFFITILMFSSLVLFAGPYSGGAGIEIKPYLIANLDDLIELSNSPEHWFCYFLQTKDIDASPTAFMNLGDHDNDPSTLKEYMGFSPIGNSAAKFKGSYNGQNHKIYALVINRPLAEYVGVFGYTDIARISNMNLKMLNIKAYKYVGGLIGYSEHSNVTNISAEVIVECIYMYGGGLLGYTYNSSVDNCYIDGDVTGNRFNGGLVGTATTSSEIENSYSAATVIAYSESGGFVGMCSSSTVNNSYATGKTYCEHSDAGGFVGESSYSDFLNCYATGDVNGFARVGGFCGMSSSMTEIKNCYASGNITGGNGIMGGFAGRNMQSSIINSYSTGYVFAGIPGSFVGANSSGASIDNCYATGFVKNIVVSAVGFCSTNDATSTITNCYYDEETTDLGENDIASDQNNQEITALSSIEFTDVSNFHASWKIDGYENDSYPWMMNENARPYLYWQSISISNANAYETTPLKYKINGDYKNVGAVSITRKGYRYRLIDSDTWLYIQVLSKNINICYEFSNLNANSEYIIQSYVKDNTGLYYFGDASYLNTDFSTLPVSLLYFEDECFGNSVQLNWSTASETNNDFFTIEYSSDAANWEVFEYVLGNGTVNVQTDYSISANTTNGTQYFRLSQTDYDGTYEILQVISVGCANTVEVEINVYPNPATNFVRLTNVDDSEVYIYNSCGILVKSIGRVYSNNSSYTINVSDLPTGVYNISIIKNTFTQNISLLVSK